MTTQDFRAAVFADVKDWGLTNFPSIPIVYENGPVPDEASIGDIWVDLELRWYSGSIASVGSSPRMRHTGAVQAEVYFKQAAGTGLSDQVVDSLAARLQVRRLGGAILLAPQRTVPTFLRGWYKTGILVPFTLG